MTDMNGSFVGRFVNFMSLDVDNPELLKARCASLSRLLPLMYAILVANSWILSITFIDRAPAPLTIGVSSALTVICAIRLVVWWRTRGVPPSTETATRELWRTPRLTAVLSLGFSSWAIALFPYGDPFAQTHVAVFVLSSSVTCMFCLIHLPSAAILIAGIVSPTFDAFLLSRGTETDVAIVVNFTLIMMVSLIVILIQNRDFVQLVEEQKRTEALSNENLRLANLDVLTNLPNRRAFFSHLADAFLQVQAGNGRLAVGIIDLDGFKPINDLYGHAAGDRLLADVGLRLSDITAMAGVFIARIGGDEFAYAVSDAPDDASLIAFGEAVCTALRTPFMLGETKAKITGSVGIAVYPELASSPDQLFERADYALYYVKKVRRGGTMLFSADHEAQLNEDARVEQALKTADLHAELSVHFQPIIDIRSSNILGFEALARWHSPVLGHVPPSRFIPIAERAGFIGHLTRPLLQKALNVAQGWPGELRLAFNLSAHDLNSAEGVLGLISIIERSGFDPNLLDLEITETALAHDFSQVQRSIEMLRLLGCGFSLDDFGTGYSSLSHLHDLPLTKIKIDRSFVADLSRSPTSLKIVKSLLALSRDMGLECVVEGVETEEEMVALKRLGGLIVQGYYYSPPIPANKVASLISQFEDSQHHGATLANIPETLH